MGDLSPVWGKGCEVLVEPIEASSSLPVPEQGRIHMVHGSNEPNLLASC